MRHKYSREDVDFAQLSEELSESLGRPVAISARPPGQVDDDGKPLDGVLILHDAETGEELEDYDASKISSTLKAHKPRVLPEQAREQALAAAEAKAQKGDTTGALADLFALLRSQ